MPRIFISYRRVDTGDYAGRIADRLKAVFGDEQVFKDSYNIKPGADFRGAIREEVSKADVVLALIGPDWLDVLEQRRNDPHDWVKLELETGLQRDGVIVIPLLLAGASIPLADRLPDSLRELSYKNGFSLRLDDPYFGRDMTELINFLKSVDSDKGPVAGGNQQVGGSGNVQQNIGTVNNSNVIGQQRGQPDEPKGCLSTLLSSPLWAGIAGIAAIIGVVVAIIALPQLQGRGQNVTETPTLTPSAEDATDTPDSTTITLAASDTPVSVTSPPSTATDEPIIPSITAPAVEQVDGPQLTIFRDEDSFTLLAPQGSNLTGLIYRVTVSDDTEDYPLENYAGFRGLPFDNLPQAICFRLIRSGGTRPTPLDCQDGTLLLTHQLAIADRFWRDGSAGLDRTVLIYHDTDLLGTCGAGQDRCTIGEMSQTIVPTADVVANPPATATQIVCQGRITSNTGASVQVRQIRQTNVSGQLIQSGVTVTILERSADNWYRIEYVSGGISGWIPVANVEAFNDCA